MAQGTRNAILLKLNMRSIRVEVSSQLTFLIEAALPQLSGKQHCNNQQV